MYKPLTLFCVFIATLCTIKAQVAIGTTKPHHSAILDVSSKTKGFLPPRLTLEQRNQISAPANGLLIYCYDCCPFNTSDGGGISFYAGKWVNIPSCEPDPGSIKKDDWDKDGIPDEIDIDDDNDGILDTLETWTITRLKQQLGFNMKDYIHESGSLNKINSTYRYKLIQPDVDLVITILNITGPVSLVSLDKSTSGEEDNFNPIINYRGYGNDEGQIDFRFDFVESGTLTPKIVSNFLFSPRDVDGSGSSSQMGEFQIVKDPNEIIVDAKTTLTIIKQGNDYRVEGDPKITNPGLGPQKEFLTSTLFSNKSSVEISLGIQKKLSGYSDHNRLFSISTQPNVLKKYDLPVLTSGYQEINRDSDDDGFTDQFDLDSDGDGCSDAYESKLTKDPQNLFQFSTNQVGANGLYDALETFPDSGILKRKPDIESPYNSKENACL